MSNIVENSFSCLHCHRSISEANILGTVNRNHCTYCLWSKHVDLIVSGDRKAACGGGMRPIGVTFKKEGIDKYGKRKQGEIMVVHYCEECNRISINRIAGDDSTDEIMNVFEKSLHTDIEMKNRLQQQGIELLEENDREEIKRQLFGE